MTQIPADLGDFIADILSTEQGRTVYETHHELRRMYGMVIPLEQIEKAARGCERIMVYKDRNDKIVLRGIAA